MPKDLVLGHRLHSMPKANLARKAKLARNGQMQGAPEKRAATRTNVR